MSNRLLTFALLAASVASAAPISDFDDAQGALRQYCQACHAGEAATGGFNLDRFPTLESLYEKPSKWQTAMAKLRNREMPPRGAPEIPADEAEQLAGWIEATLHEAACAAGPTPGPNIIRRLNRSEYAATIRDLLNVHFNAGHGLPADGAGGEGFDNAAEALFLSPVHAEKYLEAAKEALGYGMADPKSRARFLVAEPDHDTTPEQAARKVLQTFVRRAFRRPVDDGEIEPYFNLFEKARRQGDDFDAAITFALTGVLISPEFLYRVEEPNTSPEPKPVSDYELATRLSYFVWGAPPDDELLLNASSGMLHDPLVLEQVTLCMLESIKTREFSERFVEQWLGTRELGRNVSPDPKLFPEYQDDELQMAIRYEPILLFDEIVSNGLSLLNLLDSDFTMANKTLLRHYGLDPNIKGLRDNPEHVALEPNSHRGGILPMAAVLAVSSFPHRTSPVLRGKWVLETLLGTPPPPPPPNVPPLDEEPSKETPTTLRARMELHRSNPICASCHDSIDPIGFGLENYDVLGRWREQDHEQPIDSRGVLPDGTAFDGPEDLKAVLLDRKDQVMRALTAKMLAYALGRGLTLEDACTVDEIVEKLRKTDYNAHTLIVEIVRSVPFRYKPGAEPTQ